MTTQDISFSGREPTDLDDQQLRELTSFYRRIVDHGGVVPLETLQRCEAEMNRRFGGDTTEFGITPHKPQKPQKRWFERWLQ